MSFSRLLFAMLSFLDRWQFQTREFGMPRAKGNRLLHFCIWQKYCGRSDLEHRGINIPSRERSHIPPWEKENHRLKSALGWDMLVSQEGIPLGGNKSDNIWTENSSFGATGFDLLSWMRKFYIPILHLMYTVHVGRKMCVSSKDSSWTYWDHILQWDIYALTQITKTSTTRFGSQSKIPNIQIAFSLFLTGKVSQLKNISTSQLSKYYNRQEFEIACAICAWISAPSRAESGTVLDRTSATQYP